MLTNTNPFADGNRINVPQVIRLLRLIARYRLVTFETVARSQGCANLKPRRLRQLLRSCRDAKLLSSALLHSGRRYWFLTEMGAHHCGLDTARSGPLSEMAKLRAYALLLFCCHSDRPRHRLTTEELSQRFPALHRPGMPSTYYFDPADLGRIGLARVDAGHTGRWDRMLQSVRRDLKVHSQRPGFRQLVQAGRFEITVLTVLPTKAKRATIALEAFPASQPCPLHVVALPKLMPLIQSRFGKEAGR